MYVSGFVAPVPEGNKEAYRRMSEDMAAVFRDAGATEVMEAWEEDIEDGKQTDFRRAVALEQGEKVVFSWVIWPDKATADASHDKMMSDPRMKDMDMNAMPFDGKRMIYGGFEPLVSKGRD